MKFNKKIIITILALLCVSPVFAVITNDIYETTVTNIYRTNIINVYQSQDAIKEANQFYDDSMDRLVAVISIILGIGVAILLGLQISNVLQNKDEREKLLEKASAYELKFKELKKDLETKVKELGNEFKSKTEKLGKKSSKLKKYIGDFQINLDEARRFGNRNKNFLHVISQDLDFNRGLIGELLSSSTNVIFRNNTSDLGIVYSLYFFCASILLELQTTPPEGMLEGYKEIKLITYCDDFLVFIKEKMGNINKLILQLDSLTFDNEYIDSLLIRTKFIIWDIFNKNKYTIHTVVEQNTPKLMQLFQSSKIKEYLVNNENNYDSVDIVFAFLKYLNNSIYPNYDLDKEMININNNDEDRNPFKDYIYDDELEDEEDNDDDTPT